MVSMCIDEGFKDNTSDTVENCGKCLKMGADLDMLNLFSNAYLLIVPSKNKSSENKHCFEPEKMITLASEDFLIACQSLFAIPHKDDPDLSRKNEPENCSQPPTELEKNDTINVGGNQRTEVRTVSVGTQTIEVEPNKRNLVRSDYRDKVELSRTVEKSSENHELTSDDCKGVYKSASVGQCITNHDLKNALQSVSPAIKNIALNEFGPWNSNREMKNASPVMYLRGHLALLFSFVSSSNVSYEVNRKLLTRYIHHLEKLTARFCRKKGCQSVIEFDKRLLSCVRKSECWDFTQAWIQTEAIKENHLPAPKKKKDITRRRFAPILYGCKPRLNSTSNQLSSHPEEKQARTEKYVSRHSSSRFESGFTLELFNRDAEEMVSGNKYVERHVEIASLTNKSSSVLKRPGYGAEMSVAKRKRREGDDALLNDIREEIDDNAFTQKRLYNHGEHKPLCKFYNKSNGCFKAATECFYAHVCGCCNSSFHGKYACPKMQ